MTNIFVLGLDEENLATLRSLPDADQYTFHRLLEFDELQASDIDIEDLLQRAERQLSEFDGTVDAVVGYWDFPVSSIAPILCARFGTSCVSLAAVLKCEHKYWSRLEQSAVIDEYPPFGLVDMSDERPPEGVGYPLWLKPVKAFSSELAFKINNDEEFSDAMVEIRDGIDRFGDPFEQVLERVDLPEEIASAGGNACVAEEAAQGTQVTVEGYVHGGQVHVYGIVDSVNYSGTSSFLRYQYPSTLPEKMAARLSDISSRVVEQVGMDGSAFNIEYFWDRDDDTVRLLEVNPRHSQSHATLFEYVDGVPNHQCMIRLALGRDPELPSGQGPYDVAAKWFVRRFSDGVVRHAPTGDEIAAIERDVPGTSVELIAHDGDRLSELPEQDTGSFHIATVHIGASDESELTERYERCLEALPYDIEHDA